LKALEAIYAQPASVGAPVQGASKHWDQILTGNIYNAKPGSSTGGYLTWSRWELKPGEMRSYTELTKSALVPVLEKVMQGAMFVLGAALIVAFALRTLRNLRDVGDKFDFTSNW